jgi:hypothetical protein
MATSSIDLPKEVDFSFIPSGMTRQLASTSYNSVTALNMWDFFQEFKPEEGKGFMFSSHPKLTQLGNYIENTYHVGHSGASWGCSMRIVQFIANNGITKYRQKYDSPE